MQTTTYQHHGVTIHEHHLDAPLDHDRPVGSGHPTIEIFARELVAPGCETKPRMVFLQGGPGGPGPRQGDWRDSWVGRILQDFRLVLLDQRGTGLSTLLDAATLSYFATPREQADYLHFFLQRQIIGDAEMLRQELQGDEPWWSLGQSYGGFLTIAYLSLAPQGLASSLITGGLPGLTDIDTIYRKTYEATAARNRVHFRQYPQDEAMVRRIAAHLADTEELLPTGERLTPARFRAVGMDFGMQMRTDLFHLYLEGPFVSVRGEQRLSSEFLRATWDRVALPPMYAVLHESIYAGVLPSLAGRATNWSADRLSYEFEGFRKDTDPLDTSVPYYLTGEHMMREFFTEDPALVPLAQATDLLAHDTDFQPVYLPEVLAENQVPVAAAVYYDDMFVPRTLSEETGALIGAKMWITNQYQHDGSRASGGDVFTHLLDMLRD